MLCMFDQGIWLDDAMYVRLLDAVDVETMLCMLDNAVDRQLPDED